MKKLILTVLILIFYSSIAGAWTISADFESGTVGQIAYGTSGFSGAGIATLYSDAKAHTGSKSAVINWPAGSDGWGVGHGEFKYPSVVSDGGEIWVRGYFYFASPWSWTCSPVAKLLRIHVANADGKNVGYHSILFDSSGNIVMSNEVEPYAPKLSTKIPLDNWTYLELYVKASISDPIVRAWKDGVLIYEDKTKKTINESTNKLDFSYIHTYWNGGAPQNQIEYMDNFLITTERPNNIDSAGNSMIGPTDWGGPRRFAVRAVTNE